VLGGGFDVGICNRSTMQRPPSAAMHQRSAAATGVGYGGCKRSRSTCARGGRKRVHASGVTVCCGCGCSGGRWSTAGSQALIRCRTLSDWLLLTAMGRLASSLRCCYHITVSSLQPHQSLKIAVPVYNSLPSTTASRPGHLPLLGAHLLPCPVALSRVAGHVGQG
jgi:hypothetical protein